MKSIPYTICSLYLFASLLLATVSAHAAVTLNIQSISKKVSTTYSGLADVAVTESISVRHKGDATSFFLTFSAGQSGDFSNRVLIGSKSMDSMSYQLYNNTTDMFILKDLSGATTDTDVLVGSFGASTQWQSATLTFVFFIPSDQFVAADKYEDSTTVTLYEGTLSSNILHDSDTISFSVDMDEIAEISVVETGLPFNPNQTSLTFDFGSLEAGEVKTGDVIARSNAVFSLEVQSDNGGVMEYLDNPSDTSVVPYLFRFNGSEVSLAGNQPVVAETNQGPSGVDGLRYPFSVEIQPYGMATAGDYSDLITVTISTK